MSKWAGGQMRNWTVGQHLLTGPAAKPPSRYACGLKYSTIDAPAATRMNPR